MRKTFSKKNRGFTLIELMIVVAIIGILAAVAIPNFLKYQLRAKSSEASVNLSAIQTSQLAYYGSHDAYLEADSTPDGDPTPQRRAWPDPGTEEAEPWEDMGWKPEGSVYFSYQVSVANNAADGHFTAEAIGNLDGDEDYQCWLYQKRNSLGAVLAPADEACVPVTSREEQVYKASRDGIF